MSIHIESLETTSGFLKDALVAFDQGLTCIIGARGTCKSTIVETLRFAFDCVPERVADLVTPTDQASSDRAPTHRGLIYATLASGTAKCEVCRRGSGGTEAFTIEREIDGNPRIFRDGIQELADQEVLHCVEIYSQGDLQNIAQNESRRLDLIDRPNKSEIERLSAQRTDLANSLRAIGPRIRAKSTEIETRSADVRALESLRNQLTQLQAGRPSLSAELDKERDAFTKRKELIEATSRAIADRSLLRSELQALCSKGDRITAPPSDLSAIAPEAAAIIHREFDQLTAFVQQLEAELKRDVDKELSTQFSTLKEEADRQNVRYFELRQGQLDINDALKKEDTIKQQIAHLERVQSELVRFTQEKNELKSTRAKHRTALREIADTIFALRQSEVDIINERHSDAIVLSIEQGIRSEEYTQRLLQLIQGSRIRGQDEVARDVAAKIKPSDLIDIVENSDVDRLTTILQRDVGQMTRLIAFLSDQAALYDVEGVVFEDRLEITMYDQNVAKPVSQLSKGQMATALLPLILRPAPYPLIFDQPEDDLDNSFIYETLVQHVNELKQSRQLIFVTHNANIPVLGDADKVIVMEMNNPHAAKAPIMGTVDCVKDKILSLLEGGAEAFQRRREKYGNLLSTVTEDAIPAQEST